MESLDIYIHAVAKKYGIMLKKDDPIVILHTFIELFLNDIKATQIEVMQEFASSMENEYTKWDSETKARAERILSIALEAGKRSAHAQLETGASEVLKGIRKAIEPQIEKLEAQHHANYRLALANMIAAGLLAVAGMFIFLR